MKSKNIIWDWNGTIIDDAWVFVEIMNGLLKQNALSSITIDDYKKKFCFPIQDYWRSLGFSFTEKEFGILNNKFIKEYQKKMFLPKIHRGVYGLCSELQKNNFNQFVLSASESSLLKKSVVFYGVNKFFSAVWGVNNLNAAGKCNLGISLCEKHKLDVNQTLVVGDTEYDCAVARALGCRVILISHGHINHERLLKTGVPVVASIVELERLLLSF